MAEYWFNHIPEQGIGVCKKCGNHLKLREGYCLACIAGDLNLKEKLCQKHKVNESLWAQAVRG
jgi:hypothetical protein